MKRPQPALILLLALTVMAGCGTDDPEPEGALPGTDARPPASDVPGAPDESERVPRGPSPALEVDRPYWWGENTRAAEISASFLSPEARHSVLDPEGLIGRIEGREWRLMDILVQVRFRGPRAGATWQVAGPGAVIERYLEELRSPAARSPIEELGVLDMEARPCCGTDADDPPPPDVPPLPPEIAFAIPTPSTR